MIMSLKVLMHGITGTITEVVGYSVATTLAIIHRISIIETINGWLQTGVLIISIAVGVATFIYTIIQIRQASKNNPKQQ
jgi:hypothetical protein